MCRKIAFPYEWARRRNNLGAAYSKRIRGERAENLELAIVACNQSLEDYTRDAFPYEWAVTQNNLGNAYSKRILGEKADNLELAIVAYSLSLEVMIVHSSVIHHQTLCSLVFYRSGRHDLSG